MVTVRSGTREHTSEETKQDSNASSGKYEDYRKRRIQENMQKMHEMGITNLSIGTPSTKLPRRTPTKASHLSPRSQSSLPSRRSSRLQKISPVDYSEIRPPKGKKGEQVLIDEGVVPEVYTEEHERLLGSCQNVWVLFQDGYGKDGKRIYDPFNGKTCHQCRQKTLGCRTSCSKCNLVQGQFCGDCLYMRYGENVIEVNRTPGWICPVCRGICNCSLCRIKKGWLPTGPLYKKITRLGYKSVAHYLVQTHRFNAKNDGDDDKADESTLEGPLNFLDADQTDMENKLSGVTSESCQDPEDLIGQQKEPSGFDAKGDDDSPAATMGLINQQDETSVTAFTDNDDRTEQKNPSDMISLDNDGHHENAILESSQSGHEIAGVVYCNLNISLNSDTKELEVNVLESFSPTTPEIVRKQKKKNNENDSERTSLVSDSIAGRIKRRHVGMIQFCRA